MKRLVLHCGDYLSMRWSETTELTGVISQMTESPAAMSKYGRDLLTRWEESDVDVEAFTNNDNVLNGLRVAVKEASYKTNPNWITIFFWHKEGTVEAKSPTKINIDKEGALSEWPVGFFDQIENDLCKLLR